MGISELTWAQWADQIRDRVGRVPVDTSKAREYAHPRFRQIKSLHCKKEEL
jgi:hypothetical protein